MIVIVLNLFHKKLSYKRHFIVNFFETKGIFFSLVNKRTGFKNVSRFIQANFVGVQQIIRSISRFYPYEIL